LAAKPGEKKSGQTDNRLHSGRLFAKLWDPAASMILGEVYIWYLARVHEEPRDSSQLAGGSHLFCDVTLVHNFRGEKIHHLHLPGVNISSPGQNGPAQMRIALQVVQI
jgi:hypothetical protein